MYNKKNNYSKLEQKILLIAKNDYPFFLNKPYVVGVGLGTKVKKGFYTNERCIKVFVTKKLRSNFLCKSQLVPPKYKNIKTDVVQSGPFVYSSLNRKVRPTLGGYSTGNALVYDVGSIGCIVTDSSNYYLLSNNHVYASLNTVPLRTPILQPGLVDRGRIPKDVVGSLSKFISIRFTTHSSSPVNYVDCALGKLDRLSLASSKIAFIGNLKGVANAELNEVVQKSGRTTDYTVGRVVSIGITAEVGVDPASALFKDQIATSEITDFGDSGCLLVNSKLQAVGLYFSNCAGFSLYNPIYKVLSSLGVSIYTNI